MKLAFFAVPTLGGGEAAGELNRFLRSAPKGVEALGDGEYRLGRRRVARAVDAVARARRRPSLLFMGSPTSRQRFRRAIAFAERRLLVHRAKNAGEDAGGPRDPAAGSSDARSSPILPFPRLQPSPSPGEGTLRSVLVAIRKRGFA